jgi:hypothetical protein
VAWVVLPMTATVGATRIESAEKSGTTGIYQP